MYDQSSVRFRSGRYSHRMGLEPVLSGGLAGPRRAYARAMNVGVVGLGYVGLPLALSFCEAGHTVIGVDVDSRKIATLERGESYIEDVRRIPACRARAPGAHRAVRAALSRCDAVIIAVPTPLTRQPRAGSRPAHRRDRCTHHRAPAGTACRDRVDHLPAPPVSGSSRCSRSRTGRWAGLQYRLLAGAHRPGPDRLHHAQHPESGRRPDLRLPRSGLEPVRGDLRPGGARLDPRRGRAHQVARERLPVGEHRVGQRACDAVRPHGNRHLGGCRRGVVEALRLHALRARSGMGGHACRSTRSTCRGGPAVRAHPRTSSSCRRGDQAMPRFRARRSLAP